MKYSLLFAAILGLSANAYAVKGPPPYREMCAREPTMPECGGPVAKVDRTPVFGDLRMVNDTVNGELIYVTDQVHYGVPAYWEVPKDGKGVCHAYAMLKFHRLLDLGWNIKDLHLAVGRINDKEYHAVLVVDYNDRKYVLDSYEDRVLQMKYSEVRFIGMQSSGDSQDWVLTK